MKLLLAALSFAMAVVPLHAQSVVYVDRDATGTGDGSSWIDAHTDLQQALASTNSGEIWVAAGTYTPACSGGDRWISFELRSGVALYGGFAGFESLREQRDPDTH